MKEVMRLAGSLMWEVFKDMPPYAKVLVVAWLLFEHLTTDDDE